MAYSVMCNVAIERTNIHVLFTLLSVTFSSIFGPLSIKANFSRISFKKAFKNFGMELYTAHRDWVIQSNFRTRIQIDYDHVVLANDLILKQ